MDETLFQLVDSNRQTGTDEMGIWQLLIIALVLFVTFLPNTATSHSNSLNYR